MWTTSAWRDSTFLGAFLSKRLLISLKHLVGPVRQSLPTSCDMIGEDLQQSSEAPTKHLWTCKTGDALWAFLHSSEEATWTSLLRRSLLPALRLSQQCLLQSKCQTPTVLSQVGPPGLYRWYQSPAAYARKPSTQEVRKVCWHRSRHAWTRCTLPNIRSRRNKLTTWGEQGRTYLPQSERHSQESRHWGHWTEWKDSLFENLGRRCSGVKDSQVGVQVECFVWQRNLLVSIRQIPAFGY